MDDKATFSLAGAASIFPVTITFGDSDERIVLHADGSCQGNAAALRKCMAEAKGWGGIDYAVIWLLVAEMERRER